MSIVVIASIVLFILSVVMSVYTRALPSVTELILWSIAVRIVFQGVTF